MVWGPKGGSTVRNCVSGIPSAGKRALANGQSTEAPIPCKYLSPDIENDSCPIVREPVHVTFANDRLSSPVARRSGRSQPIDSQVTCAPDRSQPHKVSASLVA